MTTRALVTGATGFLGKKLSLSLQEEGWEVIAFGRNENVGQELQSNQIKFFKGDLENHNDVYAAMHKCTHVFHCGALSSPWGKYKDFHNANVLGTKNIINSAMQQNIDRLIHVSTPSIYVEYDNRKNILESDPLPTKPINHYVKTKLLAENLIDKAHDDGLPVVTIRPQGIFGPEDTNIFPRIIRTCKRGYMPIIGQGENLVDITYIDNVVHALKQCVSAPDRALGQKYNITNGDPQRLYSLLFKLFNKLDTPISPRYINFSTAMQAAKWLERIFKTVLLGKEPPLTEYMVLVMGLTRTLSIDKAKHDLNYNPKISIDDGLDRFALWWRQNHGFA